MRLQLRTGRDAVAPIVVSVEISRRPEDVFAYVTDPSRLPEWQASAVKVQTDDAPTKLGTRVVVTRKAGPREMDMAVEVDEFNPPRSWGVRGVDGPVRGNVKGRIEPLDDGARSRVTINLEFEGHGIGKLLVPLIVRRQAQKEMPQNVQTLKQRLEAG
jgi:uncharacterized protein YndB with AHSA1/START domain